APMHRPTTFVNSRLRRGEPRGGGSTGGCGPQWSGNPDPLQQQSISEEDIERERLRLERQLHLQQQQRQLQPNRGNAGFPARRPYCFGYPYGGASAGSHRPEQEWQNPVVADDRAGPNGPAANGRGGGRRRGRNRQQQQYADEFEHEYQVERHIEPLPTATGAFSVTIQNDRCRNADPDRGGSGGGGGRRRKSRRNRRAIGGRGGGDVGDVGAMPGEVEGATPAVPEDGGFIDDDLDGVGAGVGGDAGGGGGGSWEQQLVADEIRQKAAAAAATADASN
ncbi:hypothetical protein BOX15_Mlig005490g1, partial [Macrostomum lignano]